VNADLLNARQTKYAAYATVYILVVLIILVIGNFLANAHDKTFDATANKRYSLSPQTAKIVKELKQDADVTYFDQPTGFERAKDVFQQYTNLSSRIHVKYVDIDKEPQLARAAGVTRPGEAIVQIGDKKEEAKSVDEEGITGAFIRDLKNTARNICFVQGSGEHAIDDNAESGYSRLSKFLGRDEYTAKSINLLEKAEVPADCTVMVLGGPTKDYLQPEVDAIKKYVEGGGRALFLMDPPLKMGKTDIADNDALTSLLQSWGVTLDKDLILDLNPIGQIVGVGPEVALVSSYNSHPIVNEMKRTATGFPLARSIEVKNTDKTNVEKLFDSSGSSLATTTLDSPKVNAADPKNKKGPLTLAAAGTYNTGKENSQGRFVVVGSSNWAANSFVNFNGNADLALNAMNWLASDEDLISIRPKDRDDRRITMTGGQLNLVRLSSQFLFPLVVIVAGVSIWWKRR
jgi:ABC-type uncharacterized transport system involved in gliding motility auxiliary subunit